MLSLNQIVLNFSPVPCEIHSHPKGTGSSAFNFLWDLEEKLAPSGLEFPWFQRQKLGYCAPLIHFPVCTCQA